VPVKRLPVSYYIWRLTLRHNRIMNVVTLNDNNENDVEMKYVSLVKRTDRGWCEQTKEGKNWSMRKVLS